MIIEMENGEEDEEKKKRKENLNFTLSYLGTFPPIHFKFPLHSLGATFTVSWILIVSSSLSICSWLPVLCTLHLL